MEFHMVEVRSEGSKAYRVFGFKSSDDGHEKVVDKNVSSVEINGADFDLSGESEFIASATAPVELDVRPDSSLVPHQWAARITIGGR